MELDALHLKEPKYGLFLKRRFLPIFMATFLGSFNDNLLRSGLVVLIAYAASKGIALPTKPEILVTICSALLVAPLVLFSSIAGPLADKFEKSRLVVYTKGIEVIIMCCVCYGFATQSIYILMFMLFISGTHTTFYAPIKYSILPSHLSTGELLAANGFMAGGGFIAVLFGLITGGLVVESPHNLIGVVAIAVSMVGFAASLFVPPSPSSHPDIHVSLNIWKGTRHIVEHAWRDKTVALSILALSWFMMVGGVYMSQFPNYAHGVMHANNEVYILFLTVFSIGIAIGSLVCDTLLKGEISPRLTPVAAFGISMFTYLMVFTTPRPTHEGLVNVHEFLANPQHWPVLGCMLMVAVSGGIYIVPLYALLQSRTHPHVRSRVMAASNLSDALFMTVAALVSAVLLSFDFSILDLFTIVATLNLGVVWYARKVT